MRQALDAPQIGTQIAAFICYNVLCLSFLAIILLPFFRPLIGLYILLPYFTFTIVVKPDELKKGAAWQWFAQDFWPIKIMRSYLRQEILPLPKELEDLEKKEGAQFIFAAYPHGCWCDFRLLMDGQLYDIFPNVGAHLYTLAASVLFRLPIMREIALWSRCVDARRSVAEKFLKRGKSLVILPGGEAEQIRTEFGKEIVYIKKRKGFIKLAMRKGVPLVPMYVFGCSDCYRTSKFLIGPRMWLQKNLQVCVPLAWGLFGSMFCPRPVEVKIVFGKPLQFQLKKEGHF